MLSTPGGNRRMVPENRTGRTSIISLADDTNGRLGMLLRVVNALESLVIQDKKEETLENKKRVRQYMSDIKQRVSDLLEEDVTSDDIINEAQNKVQKSYDEGKFWKQKSESQSSEINELKNKMVELTKSYKSRESIFVEQLDKYKAGHIPAADFDDVDSQALAEARQEIKSLKKELSAKEYENIQLQTKNQLDKNQSIDSYKKKLAEVSKQAEEIEKELMDKDTLVFNLEKELKEKNKIIEDSHASLGEKETMESVIRQRLERDINDLTADNTRYSNKILALEETIAQKNAELESLGFELTKSRTQNEEMNTNQDARIEELEIDLEHKVSDIKRLSAQVEQAMAEKKDLENLVQSYQNDLSQSDLELDRVNSQLNDSRAQIEKLKLGQDDRINQLEMDLDTKSSDLKRTQQLLESYKGQLSEKTLELDNALYELKLVRSQIENYSTQIPEYKLDMESYKRQISQKSVELERITLELKDTRSEYDQFAADQKTRIEELKNYYAQQMEKYRQRIEDYENELSEKNRMIESATNELEDCRPKLNQLKHVQEMIADLKETKSKVTHDLQQTISKMNQVASEAAHNEEEIARLESAKSDTSARLQEALDGLQKLQERNKQLELELTKRDTLLSQFDDMNATLDESAKHIESLENALQDKDDEMSRRDDIAQQTVEQLQARIQALRTKLQTTEKQLLEAKQQSTDLEKSQSETESYIESLTEKINMHEREIRDARAELTRKNRDIHDLTHSLNMTQDRMEQLEQECEKMTDAESLAEDRARRICQLENDVSKIALNLQKASEHRKNLENQLEDLSSLNENAERSLREAQNKLQQSERRTSRREEEYEDLSKKYVYMRELLALALKDNVELAIPN